MKPVTEKKSIFTNVTVRENTHTKASLSISKLFLSTFLFLSLSFFSDVQATNLLGTQQQTPAKAKVKTVKKAKGKTKGKKSNVIRKDTLSDIDPANTSSPLYQKTNNK
jgi:hypothetical protein